MQYTNSGNTSILISLPQSSYICPSYVSHNSKKEIVIYSLISESESSIDKHCNAQCLPKEFTLYERRRHHPITFILSFKKGVSPCEGRCMPRITSNLVFKKGVAL